MDGRRACRRALGAVLSLLAALPCAAEAHGFGQRYDLPLPLWLYLVAAGAVVALSFAMLAAFRGGAALRAVGAEFLLNDTSLGRLVAPLPLATLARALSVALLALVIAAGLFGNHNPFKNIAPVMAWVVGWVGLSFAAALIGDLWVVLNPWSALFAWVEALHARLAPGRRFGLGLEPPGWLGAWPAVVLFLLFAWCELVWEDGDRPRSVALALVAYSALSWAGMLAVGRGAWLKRGEIFALAFGLLARFAPLAIVERRGRLAWRLRPYAVGLLPAAPYDRSRTAFVLCMLATVSFDGFSETPDWATFLNRLVAAGADGTFVASLGLALCPLFLGSVFLSTVALSRRLAGSSRSLAELAGLFVPTLVPIALAYHIAHNLSFLLLGSQYLVPMLSDPFGVGWDLFGTTLYRIDISVVSAALVWYVAVGAIVTGHVIAIWLAHEVSLGLLAGRAAALRGQLPLLVLMVGYTMLSLWILAQPITNARTGG